MKSYERVLIKPASSLCNMNCDYCFYKDEVSHRDNACNPMMSEDTVRSILNDFLPLAKNLSICFQGGEPTMAGLKWFQRFVEIERELNREHLTFVTYSIQTNGILIDEEWCKFLHENHFLVGVSFDGFPRLHDVHRGRTGRKVLSAVRMLKDHEVEFNIVCVVTDEMVDNAPQVWNYLMENDFRYLQFIPCMNLMGKNGGHDFLSPRSYGMFLRFIAQQWNLCYKRGMPVYIRLLENFGSILLGKGIEQCDINGHCSAQYVVESNGNVYPCDFYCLDECLLGNVNKDEIASIDSRRYEMRFQEDSFCNDEECRQCSFRPFCNGGCKRNRVNGRFRFCESYRMFLEDGMQHVVEVVSNIKSMEKGSS